MMIFRASACLLGALMVVAGVGCGADASPTADPTSSSSTASAMGGNLGGLAGADARCQALATAVGAGARTWHAYLSLSGPTPTHARDRIGTGPWYNVKGVRMAANVAQLHDEGGTMNAL